MRLSIKRIIPSSVLGLLLCLLPLGSNAEQGLDVEAAQKTVEDLHFALIASMQAAGTNASLQQREAMLTPIIKASLDLPQIAAIVLGRHRRALDDEQRENFLKLLTEEVASTYAARFTAWNGESFATLSVQPSRRSSRIRVRSHLLRPEAESVQFDYLLHISDDTWKIIAIFANGVNDLAIKKAEYGNILKKEGFASLATRMEEKIQQRRMRL
ncbi:MAG: ABC transporter substrate-binding protein [Candidatus Eutrophobiaceae bacterium]